MGSSYWRAERSGILPLPLLRAARPELSSSMSQAAYDTAVLASDSRLVFAGPFVLDAGAKCDLDGLTELPSAVIVADLDGDVAPMTVVAGLVVDVMKLFRRFLARRGDAV